MSNDNQKNGSQPPSDIQNRATRPTAQTGTSIGNTAQIDHEKVLSDRKNVAELIRFVLTRKLCVREAINRFPHKTEDESIQAAYHALVHFEADEDLRKRDALYKEEQDSYLIMIAEILEKGDDLPFNIINSYKEYYKSANIPNGNDFKGKLKSFFRMLNV